MAYKYFILGGKAHNNLIQGGMTHKNSIKGGKTHKNLYWVARLTKNIYMAHKNFILMASHKNFKLGRKTIKIFIQDG